MNILTTVTKVTCDINGLFVSYQRSSALRLENRTLTLCPYATCQFLQAANMIEGFEMDANNEPVILFTSNDTTFGYDGEPWCNFVKTFRITHRYAEMMIEARKDRAFFQDMRKRLKRLQAA